jgi:PKD repeat protein
MRMLRTIVAIAASLSIAACTLKDGEGPSPTGPSEFALSVVLSATPDRLPRDGSSQSVITVTVRDEASRPVAGQRLSVASSVGTLSAADVVTNANGQGSVTFTAPDAGTVGNQAMISVVPFGTNAGNAVPRTLSIAFIGPSNSSAPSFGPLPFAIMPVAPEVGAPTRFDASGTVDASGRLISGVFDEGVPCMQACSYSWDFGDGSTASGLAVSHTYSVGRTYTVTLIVTDAAGTSSVAAQSVIVRSVPAPSVTISVLPASPPVGQLATFTATATPATGHSIQSFAWNFGDGTTQSTTVPTAIKSFSTAGVYVVTVTATDDLGQHGSSSLTVTVGSGIVFPQPPFTVSPATPLVNQAVSFNGSAVTTLAGATITEWAWDFGDGGTSTGAAASTTHTYGAIGTYVVRLTVTDSAGRTGTATVSVSVSTP